ncbi:MAG: hypothetical protein NUV77_21405, partial [Thermoguttaceae bacterium]|nr:hypothetical protein [Thermoguttaceae bacterium]
MENEVLASCFKRLGLGFEGAIAKGADCIEHHFDHLRLDAGTDPSERVIWAEAERPRQQNWSGVDALVH